MQKVFWFSNIVSHHCDISVGCWSNKNVERGKITCKTWVMYKYTKTKNCLKKRLKNLSTMPKLHTNCRFKNTDPKVDHHTGGTAAPNATRRTWAHFYQTRSAWSMDQGSNENHSPVKHFAPTVTKFCVTWEGKPSHVTQNLVTVGTKLWTAERFLVDPWSMDQADLVW